MHNRVGYGQRLVAQKQIVDGDTSGSFPDSARFTSDSAASMKGKEMVSGPHQAEKRSTSTSLRAETGWPANGPRMAVVRRERMENGTHMSARWRCFLGRTRDNEQTEVPECVVGDLPEQSSGEGKCPLTHYVLHTL
ncbi:uncharacterized protein [Zea mays]|uniref:uncharacterized protein n=1 Tax=Zea mays TaxID=4577 RepID=UPI0016520F45|nr:uncharacterized protein LOC118476295 [Zea mays]